MKLIQSPRGMLLFVAVLTGLLFAGCKDHNREQVEKTGSPAPNQQAPTPTGPTNP